MGRKARFKILLGACIIGMIGTITHSPILIGGAVVLMLLSGVRYPHSPPTNYTEKFGPPDPSGLPAEDTRTPFTEILSQEDQESES